MPTTGTYLGTAKTVKELLALLKSRSLKNAAIEMNSPYHSMNAEVYYNKETNTVILK